MANLADLAGLLVKTVTQNSTGVANAIGNTIDTVKKAATVAAIKSKYQPGQSVSAADNAKLQQANVQPQPVSTVKPTSLRAPQATDKPWEKLTVPEQVKATSAEPDLLSRIRMGTNTIGSALGELNQQQQQQTAQALSKVVPGSLEERGVKTLSAAVNIPTRQISEGLKMASGGETLRETPQVSNAISSTAMGIFGATPGGAAFNAVINQPEIKPEADKVFNWLGETSKKITELPIVKELPQEAKDSLSTGLQILPFVVLHKAIKLPFKTTETVEMAHPITGEMVKVKVPVDTAGWKAFKDTLATQVEQIKKDPIEFLKNQQAGLSIKDVSGEKPTLPEPPAFKTAEQLNADIRAMQETKLNNITKDQKALSSRNEVVESVQNEPKTSLFRSLGEELNPFKYQDAPVKEAWQKLTRDYSVANEKANVEFEKLNHIPVETTKQIIRDYQSGVETPVSGEIKKVFDQLREEGINRGLAIEDRKNYLPQIYANDAAEVTAAISKHLEDMGMDKGLIQDYLAGKRLPADISNRLKLNPSFSKERSFSSYEEAAKYGLTPRYQSIAQLAAHYRNEMEIAIANRNFVEKLKDSGHLSTDQLEGYKPLETPLSSGEQLYAPAKLAKALNAYFRDESNLGFGQTFLKGLAKTNKAMQEIVLSGGLPLTNVNFFTIGQTIKSLTAAEGKVLGRAIISNSNAATKGWFRANQSYITDMAIEGIDLSKRTGNWNNFYDQLTSKTGFAKVLEKSGNWLNKAFNKKTFDNFMPMQAVSTFKNAYDSAIARGLSESEARTLAGDTTKAWNGMIEDWGRGKTTQDVVNSFFFAPRFREGLVNLYANSIRALSTQVKNPAFIMNKRFMAGAAISYIGYNLLNKQLNGNYMWENEPGKEFDLKVPYGNGNYVYIALLPSVLSFPRNMISGGIAAAKGDWETAGQKFGSLASMPVKLASEFLNNKDYFGNAIYDKNASVPEKIKAFAEYAGLEYNHPYVKAVYNYALAPESKRTNLFQFLSTISEMPFKFSNQANINKSKFYNALSKQQEARDVQKQHVQELYDRLQTMKADGRTEEANAIYNQLPKEEQDIYKSIKSSAKAQVTKSNKVDLYPTYVEIRKLKEDGKMDEANARYGELNDEQKKAYKLLRKQFDGQSL